VLPFGGRGESGIRVLLAHVHDVPVGPGEMVAGLDAEVSGYMLRLLAKGVGERPTAAEAAEELERLADKVARQHQALSDRIAASSGEMNRLVETRRRTTTVRRNPATDERS